MHTLDLSSILGLVALVALVVNVMVGLAVWTRLKVRVGRMTPFRLHKWTGYAAAVLVLAHVVLIPLDRASGFGWADLLLPLWTPHQPVANTLGAIALWLLATVVVSSYFQKRLGYPTWRKLHYLGYAALPTLLAHGLITDPALRDRPVDFLDAEKVLVEACALVFAVAVGFRLSRRGRPPSKRRPSKRGPAVAALLLLLGLTPATARAEEPHPDGWRLVPDAGLIWTRGDLHFNTWGFAQGTIAEDAAFAWRRFRQGVSLELPRFGAARAAVVYEVDLTDNNFFRRGPAWKVFENAFVALQDADDANRWRVLYGENTHLLSREDNLSSGNLPTVNRSILLESYGSIHAFGTQWGGQVHAITGHHLALSGSLGDNTGSLNQDHPQFGLVNSMAAKVTSELWRDDAGSALTVEAAVDYTRRGADPELVLGTALGAAPMLHAPATGAKLTGEADAELILAGPVPIRIETEWIASRFPDTDTIVVGGYLQGLVQVDRARTRGDLSLFVRPELVRLQAGTATAHVEALRLGLNWNPPYAGDRANVLLEVAGHRVIGDDTLVSDRNPGWELRLMLRLSAVRHARF